MADIIYRQFEPDEMRAVYPVFMRSLHDLLIRLGDEEGMGDIENPDFMEARWQGSALLMTHLSQTSDANWLAEQDGKPVGYARSVLRDNVRQLSELFLLPTVQSSGVAKGLLLRAFADHDYKNRIVIASPDPRAVPNYMKHGVYPRFSVYTFSRKPEIVPYETDLEMQALSNSPEHIAHLNRIDRTIIGYERSIDHLHLMSHPKRKGFLFLRKGNVVGYGYFGKWIGPFALEDVSDFPAVLAIAESDSARDGQESFGLDVPLINQTAVKYLLDRGFRMDTIFMEQFMLAKPMGRFENYIVTSPPFIT